MAPAAFFRVPCTHRVYTVQCVYTALSERDGQADGQTRRGASIEREAGEEGGKNTVKERERERKEGDGKSKEQCVSKWRDSLLVCL